MMPQCPAAGSSNDPEVTDGSRDPEDRWVGLCDGTRPEPALLIDHTECGIGSRHPEEVSEGTGGGPRNNESHPVQDAVPSPFQRSQEWGETRHHEAQDDLPSTIDHSHPPESPHAQIGPPHPPESPHAQSSCPRPQISAQAVEPQKRTCLLSSATLSTHVSPCSTQTTVVTPQPGVSQIVLNFREQGDGLTLDGVPPEAVSQCHGGCHVSQRVAKQIVLIFVNQPCESAKQTSSKACGDPARIVNASTQTSSGMCHPHSDRRSPPKSPHRFVRNRSCGTQTEWDRRPEIPERFPVHVNVSSMSHLVSQRTSNSTQTECTPRVPELPSSSCYAQTIFQEEEGAPGLAFVRGQGIPTPSSSLDDSSESCLGPADTLTNSWADKTRQYENLSTPLPVLGTQDPPDRCLDYDRFSLFSCQTKVSNGSRDLTDSPSDVSTSCPPAPCKKTQLSSEEPMETTTSDGQTVGSHGNLNQQPSIEKPMETIISDEETNRIPGDLNQQPSIEKPMETTTSDGQIAGRHGDLNQQPSIGKPTEPTTFEEETSIIHGELNQQPSIKKPMETTTCDGQTAGRQDDLNQQPSIEKPIETTTSDGQTAGRHGDLNQQPSIEKPMETTSSEEETSKILGELNQQPSFEKPMETTTSDEETARIHGNLNQQPFSEEAMENPSFDGQTAQKLGDHLLDTSPHIPCSHTQTDQSKKCSCVPGKRPPGLREGKPKITDDPTLKSLNRREPEHPSCSSPSNHSQKSCGTSCLSPSLSQYLDNLLEQHRMSLNEPVHHQKSPSSSSFPGSCAPPQPHVRQIILNFLEKESRPVNADVCSPGISSGTSSSLKSMAGDQNISHPASDHSSSLMNMSESQNVSNLGTSLMTSMPGDQDVIKPGNSQDLISSVLPNTTDDQGVPDPSNGSDMSSSEQLTSKILSQDVSGPGTARDALSLLITSMDVNQDILEPGSSKNSPSALLSEADSQDVPGLSTASALSELTHKPENPDVAAPEPSSISSSSALMNDKPVHQDVPSPQDMPSTAVLSKPEHQDFLGSGTASDSSLQTTSMTVTQDVCITGTPSDVSALDSRSVLTSRPVIQDIPGADSISDSITCSPLTQDVSSSDAFAHTGSSHITNIPGSKDVPETDISSSVLIRSHPEEAQVGDEAPEEAMKSKDRPENPLCQPQRPPKSHSCPALVLEAVTQEVALRLPSTDHQELVGPLQRYSEAEDELTFDDIAVYFSKEEWEVLEGPQKGLYCQVMMDNYRSLNSLGFLLDKPGLISRIEGEEAELWEDGDAFSRFSLSGGDLPPFPTRCPTDVPSLDEDQETPGNVGAESAKSSSHLGALMRLVNEIPGFLLGGSSPGQNLEDAENIRPCSEVKTEESSPSCTPASVHTQRIGETPESSSPGAPWSVEKSNPPASAKAEEVEIPIHPPYRQSQPVRHPHLPHIKNEPGACTGVSPPRQLQIKQEELPVTCSPASGVPGKQSNVPLIKIRSSLVYKQPGSWECRPADEENRWTSLPPSLPAGSFPRNTSVSPASLSDGTSSVALKDLHIKIKQEDSGSERDSVESPIFGRKVPRSPMAPSPGMLEHLRLGASPRRSTTDRKSPRPQEVPPGKSHLHGLVNCLKEISASRPWAQPNAPPPADPSRAMKRAALDSSSPSRVVSVLWRPPDEILKDEPYTTTGGSPNPFTVAVTNGSARKKGAEAKMAESVRSRVAEPPAGGALISVKCPDRVHMWPSGGQSAGGGFLKTEEPRRAELGVKRTHSDDPSCLSVKRPALDPTSPSRVVGTLWIPPDGGGMPGKVVEVKEEKSQSPIPTPTRQWAPPPGSPSSPDQSGTPSTNVHLSGLMRLMEEIPVAESSTSSRAMYNIAIGHSMMRRHDRTNFLSFYNDDGIFQAELNDNTVASVDSVYSDDTSLSSENLDPSYSAIGGLQRVVSEFAELGSVSPLVAVSVPPSTGAQEGHGLKAKEPTPGSAPRLNDSGRGPQRGMLVSAASACSAENGEAAYAALCGLQKVVRGFNEQECVSPFTAVRSAPHHGGTRESLTKRNFTQEEEGESPQLPDSSPALATRFLCEGSWLPNADSSYSALSGLQKVVNGFSDLGCVSPFSAVSTSASESAIEICSRKKSEQPTLDASCSSLCGLKKVVNGVPDSSCVSPATASSNPSSVGEPDPGVRRRCEQSEVHSDSARIHGPSNTPQRNPTRPSGQCIDLTQEEEPAGAKARTPNQEKQSFRNDRTPESSSGQATKPMGGRTRPPTSSQLIDLTEEEEAPIRHKVPSSEASRKSHSASPHKATSDRKHRAPIIAARTRRVGADRPLDPGPSGARRGGVPTVNEHISGLEKLLKGVPTFIPPNTPSGQRRSGNWWFKSTSPHET